MNAKWLDFSIETIIGGSSADGVRYLQLFLKDYIGEFGGTVNAGCKRCVNNYLTKYKLKLQQNMKTNNQSAYVLKKKYEGIQIGLTGVTVNNKNITDEMALQLLTVHAADKIFDKYPSEIDLSKTNHVIAERDGLKINSASKEVLKAFAANNGIELSSDDLDKPGVKAEVLAWLNQPLAEAAEDKKDPVEDTTNQQFATADGFDPETADELDYAAFIEKYQIPFEERDYDADETKQVVKDWLSQDTLG